MVSTTNAQQRIKPETSVLPPSQGQIVLIDEIVGPEGSIDWDLSNPFAVLIF